MLVAVLWRRHWAGRQILFYTDNLAVVQVVQYLNVVDPLSAMFYDVSIFTPLTISLCSLWHKFLV